jgi:hypothetical protein
MDRKSFFLVVGALGVATSLLPTVRGEDGASVAAFKESAGDRASSAPIILAQGRCFNGRCF